jgi:predicted secreted protein
MSRETIDTTALDTAGGYRTFISGFRNPGTMTLEVLFTRETYDKLRADFDSDVAQNYELLIPDAENTSIDFEGLVTELPLDIPPDDAIVMNVTIQISGEAASGSGSGPSPGA